MVTIDPVAQIHQAVLNDGTAGYQAHSQTKDTRNNAPNDFFCFSFGCVFVNWGLLIGNIIVLHRRGVRIHWGLLGILRGSLHGFLRCFVLFNRLIGNLFLGRSSYSIVRMIGIHAFIVHFFIILLPESFFCLKYKLHF
jgi:hypothetical protein